MSLDRVRNSKTDTDLIAADGLSRRQWELALAPDSTAAEGVWQGPRIFSRNEWLALQWAQLVADGRCPGNRHILSSDQTDWLWQRVIGSSRSGQQLIETAGIARVARVARRHLLDAGIVPGPGSGTSDSDDSAAFSGWNRQFESLLDQNDWTDPDSLLFRLNRLPLAGRIQNLTLLDMPVLGSEEQLLCARRREAGHRVDQVEASGFEASFEGRVFSNPGAELSHLCDWLMDRLERDPEARLAVVVPDLQARQQELRTVLGDAIGDDRLWSQYRQAVGDTGVFSAALSTIALFSSRTGFDGLSRWLRSPFFQHDDAGRQRRAVMLELELRQTPAAQAAFRDAWQRFGLRALFVHHLPEVVKSIDSVFERLPQRASATRWTEIWQNCLKILGWTGFELDLPDALQNAWDNAWARFSSLTPVMPDLSTESAADAFGRICASERVYTPMPIHGVIMLEGIDQIGPGYTGAWIAGFTDQSWPASQHPNPFIARSVQRKALLPGGDPSHDLEIARQALKRLAQRVPEAVFSCPRRIEDQPQTVSPMIDRWQTVEEPARHKGALARQRVGARPWVEMPDNVPAVSGKRIPGGVRTLDLQASCPAKAFCISRLGADRLDLPARGIDARLRGILTHRVLEFLFDPATTSEGPADVDSCIDQGLAELKGGDASWAAQLDAERSRLKRIVNELLKLDEKRSAFTTVAVEQRTGIQIAQWQLRGRIDRIDRIDNTTSLLIDYKTGQSADAGWFDEPLTDCQLPAYALESRAGAIALIRLTGDKVDYKGAGLESISLPGSFQSFTADEWNRQIDDWREQIQLLVAEFADGDVRVRSDSAEYVGSDRGGFAGGAFAAVTRVGDPIDGDALDGE